MLCPIVLKFDMLVLVHHGKLEVGERLNIHFWLNTRWRTDPKFSVFKLHQLSRRLFDSTQFDTEFDHTTANALHMFKSKWSNVKITA